MVQDVLRSHHSLLVIHLCLVFTLEQRLICSVFPVVTLQSLSVADGGLCCSEGAYGIALAFLYVILRGLSRVLTSDDPALDGLVLCLSFQSPQSGVYFLLLEFLIV